MPARLCRYATEPAARPDCEVTAILRRGVVPLCASCDARRSTLGKGQAPVALPPPPPADLLAWAARASARQRDAGAELTAAVARARLHGYSWQAIASSLGITRQAAWQHFGPSVPARPGRQAIQ
ncbi:MAG: hypothetical protein ACR2MP_00595 [Streptosporangiaceae bacterium]